MENGNLRAMNESHRNEVACRTAAAVEEMLANGERISFYSVAKRAQVARSTLYRRSDLRCLVDKARGGKRASALAGPGPFARLADLEGELACVRRERDWLEKKMRSIRSVEYYGSTLKPVGMVEQAPVSCSTAGSL